MISIQKGWVVININHPTTGSKYTIPSIFNLYRRDAIKDFVTGSGNDWKHWRDKYNFRCVKCECVIKLNQPIK